MQDEAISPAPRGLSRPLKIAIGVAVAFGLYYVVMAGIRGYVTSRIDASVGRPVPVFRLTDLSGERWTEVDLRGKVTVLNFFRSACDGCRAERNAIFQLATEVDHEKVQVVGVMVDAVQGFSADATAATLERYAYTHPILMADAAFADAFHGAGWSHVTPVTYIVDAKGSIVRAFRGAQTLETLRAATR